MKGNQKGVPNERRRLSLRIQKPDSIAKRPEPRIHKSSKKSKKSVESLSASDESEREGKKVAEEEKKEEEAVKVVEEQAGEVVEEQAGEIVEEYMRKKSKGGSWLFTRKHRVLGSCIGARRMPMLLYLRRVADQRGNHSGCRLLSRRGRSVKQS
ncbi:unnamed protein product, partial [Brassica oleracea]